MLQRLLRLQCLSRMPTPQGALENPNERHLSKVCVAAHGDRDKGEHLAKAIRQAKSQHKPKFDQGERPAAVAGGRRG